jgi:hypothetical protein
LSAVREFHLTGVVHLIRPVHRHAGSLEELRQGIADVEPASLFYHAVQHRLRAPGEDDLPPDDFSAWVYGVLQDREAAERLALARLEGAAGPEPLRTALVSALNAVPEATRRSRVAPDGGAFAFLASDSVPVPTEIHAGGPHELFQMLTHADLNVWFQELVESSWWDGGEPWFVRWLRENGEPRIAEWLVESARSGRSMAALRRMALARWRRGGLGRRVADAARDTEDSRRAAGRAAVAGLVKRLHGEEPR